MSCFGLQIIKIHNTSDVFLHEKESYHLNVNDRSQGYIPFQGYLTNLQCQRKDHQILLCVHSLPKIHSSKIENRTNAQKFGN